MISIQSLRLTCYSGFQIQYWLFSLLHEIFELHFCCHVFNVSIKFSHYSNGWISDRIQINNLITYSGSYLYLYCFDCYFFGGFTFWSSSDVQFVFKKYRDWRYIYQHRTETNMNETLIFFRLVPLAFSNLIPVSFLSLKAPLKSPFSYDMRVHPRIYFNLYHVLKSYFKDESLV